MDKYTPQNMVRLSRYADYFPTLENSVQKQIYDRIEELLEENREYCDKGNAKHMAAIVTSIAMYETFQENGMTEEEAFRIVSEEMWKSIHPEKMQKMSTKSWFLPFMKVIVPFGFKKGSGKGWRYTWHKEEDPKDRFHFECNECLYSYMFSKYNVKKLGPMYCYADVINYGNFPTIDFRRSKTLCRGDDCCNFDFVVMGSDKGWERTKSV